MTKYIDLFNVTRLSVLRPQLIMIPNCLLVLLAVFACLTIKAQYHEVVTAGERGFNEHPANVDNNSATGFAPELPLATTKLIPSTLGDKYLFHENRCRYISGLVSTINGSLASTRGVQNGLAGNFSSPKNEERFKWKYENLLPKHAAVSGLMLIAGSIPYLIMALQTKHKGLSLCSQKTTYGSFNTARKKVTGITFSIPIGK